jgi:hypothetical protein
MPHTLPAHFSREIIEIIRFKQAIMPIKLLLWGVSADNTNQTLLRKENIR